MFATDDWFAVAENMLQSSEPVFIADKFTDCGKWMDGWETRRKRIPGHDWCVLKLGAAAAVRGITVDTAHFTGNYAPRISVQGARLGARDEQLFPERRSAMGGACTAADAKRMEAVGSAQWTELLPMTKLRPGYAETRYNHIAVDRRPDTVCTHLRINIYPDGGIARLRVYGEVQVTVGRLPADVPVDLAAMQNGGSCVAYSNAHYGHPRNLIRPGRAVNMGDGWETQRRLDRPPVLCADERTGLLQVPGSEWAVLRLGAPVARLQRIVVDTLHFKGNFPESVRLEVAAVPNAEADTLQAAEWHVLLPAHKLAAHREHVFEVGTSAALRNDVASSTVGWNYVRVTMVPDGGISRVRVWGLRGDAGAEEEAEEVDADVEWSGKKNGSGGGHGAKVLRGL